MARDLAGKVMEAAGIKDYKIVKTVKGKALEGIECRHPFMDRISRVVLAEYVSNVDGTGCVHTAPGHGQEDYATGLRYKLPVIMPVEPTGRFDKTAGPFAGLNVFKANDKIIEHLKKTGALLGSATFTHSYPHCWRCKEPLIVRATTQWFINVDHKGLRKKTLDIIKKVKWVPAIGQNRISAMVENRPDWCLSRQRYWGVPMPAFYCKACGTELLDADIIDRISDIFAEEGSDVWFAKSAAELLPEGAACKKCEGRQFDKETDVIDVWFDSGISHQAVLKARKELGFPCDLYLEGSDQHRGWFQTALLTAVPIVKKAPFAQVLTHGFVVDGEGRKMSKSLGNVISPQDIIAKSGADVLRLWVSSCDYEGDVRISDEILVRIEDAYRKLRNTFKFILGNLYDFNPQTDGVEYDKLLEIDRWALSRLASLIKATDKSYGSFEFHTIYRVVYDFCTIELSSFYLDILKDRLYTFRSNGTQRRSAQTALYEILSALLKITAPILVFTSEEAWGCLAKKAHEPEDVHLADWPDVKPQWQNKALDARWSQLLAVRELVLKALEEKRAQDLIGNSLEAKVTLFVGNQEHFDLLNDYTEHLSSIFIVSQAELKKTNDDSDVRVVVEKADGKKCPRCWNYSKTVGENTTHPDICQRCIEAIR
jgi:isoleucyl-tRNA synthetase